MQSPYCMVRHASGMQHGMVGWQVAGLFTGRYLGYRRHRLLFATGSYSIDEGKKSTDLQASEHDDNVERFSRS